jgi:hypothetical protein
MKKNKTKSKSAAYPLLQVFIVIVIFLLIEFWSVGSFENYKKMSEFKNGLLSKDFKFKQFPPNELFGIKLYDDFEKYLFVNKDKFKLRDLNNNKYYYEFDATRSGKNRIKHINPLPGYFDEIEIYAKENGEIVGIIGGFDTSLYNNHNLLNVCTKTRNSFLKKHNLSKLNFKNEYYLETGDEFYDFKNFDLLIKNNNARFSIVCGYDINRRSNEYIVIFFLYDINLWKDLIIKHDIKITSKKINNNWIRKYHNRKTK